MNFKKWIVLGGVLLFAISCGKSSKENGFGKTVRTDRSDIKTAQSIAACKQLKFPRDLKLNGHLLYYFPQCASNKVGGGETLQGTVNIVSKIGISGLQSMIDFIFLNPQDKTNSSNSYPLLKAAMVFIERGTYQEDTGTSQTLMSERFGSLQNFLNNANPYWAMHLLLGLNREGLLEGVLDELDTFTKSYDEQSLFGFVRSVMSDPTLNAAFLNTSLNVFGQKSTYLAYSRLLNIETSSPLTEASKRNCEKSFLDPIRTGAEGLGCEVEVDTTQPSSNGKDRYLTWYKSLEDSERTGIKAFISQLLKNIIQLEDQERLELIRGLMIGLSRAASEHDSPLRHIYGLVQEIQRTDAGQSVYSAQAFDLLLKSLQKIIDQSKEAALFSLHAKMGSAKLQNDIENLLINGGAVLGCQGIILAGLKDHPLDNPAQFTSLMTPFLSPNDNCRQGLSPLLAFALTQVQGTIKSPMECDLNNVPDKHRPVCIPNQELQKVASEIKAVDWEQFKQMPQSSSELNKSFLASALEELKQMVAEDTFALYYEDLASGAVSTELLSELQLLIQDQSQLNALRISQLDQELQSESKYSQVLKRDFLEKLILYYTRKQAALSDQFEQLNTGTDDHRLFRVMFGLYNSGPIESLIATRLQWQNLPDTLKSDVPDEAAAKQILAYFRTPGRLIPNIRLKPDLQEKKYQFFGYKNPSVAHQYVKNNGTGKYELKEFTIYSRYPRNGFSFTTPDELSFKDRFYAARTPRNMMVKDAKVGKADDLFTWFGTKVIPYFQGQDFASLASAVNPSALRQSIDKRFFEVTPYSQSEARQLAVFYATKILSAPALLPQDANTYQVDRELDSKSPDIMRQHLSFPLGNDRYSKFMENFPAVWGANFANFEAFLNNPLASISQDYLLNLDWEKVREQEYQDMDPDQRSFIQILGNLNLLTRNNKKKYQPIIGTGPVCQLKNGTAVNCPIHFVDSGSTKAIDSFKNYTKRQMLSFFCPLLVEGNTANAEQVEEIEQALGLKMATSETRSACQAELSSNRDLTLVQFNEQGEMSSLENPFPKWMHGKILADLLGMGKKSELKPGLSTLAMQVRFHKLKREQNTHEVFAKQLLRSAGFLPNSLLFHSQRKQNAFPGLKAGTPSWINSYLNMMAETIDIPRYAYRPFNRSLIYYGSGVDVDSDLQQGNAQRFLFEMVIDPFVVFKANHPNEPLLKFLIQQIDQLAKPENETHRETIGLLLAHAKSLEMLPIFTETTEVLLQILAEFTSGAGQPFWSYPAHEYLRFLLKQEVARSTIAVGSQFGPDQIKRGLSSLLELLKKFGDGNQQYQLITKTSQFMRDAFVTQTSEEKINLSKIDEQFSVIARAPLRPRLFSGISHLIGQLAVKHTNFAGQETKPVVEKLDSMVEYLVERLFYLSGPYQEFFSKDSSVEEPEDYLRKLVLGMVRPFELATSMNASQAMVQLLEDQRLGTWEGIYRPLIFDKTYRENLKTNLSALDKPSKDDYLMAIKESSILVPEVHGFVNFLVEKIRWNQNTSLDVRYGFQSLKRVSNPKNSIWDKQSQLMSTWLSSETE